MSGENMSVNGGPPLAAEHASMAERFASFGAYAAWTATAPQPPSMSLDVARFHAFTGEATLLTEPAVRLYLDAGTVYFAERDGDPSIANSLLATGVVDAGQLKRGMVSVGNVEHLGRLFERDASIDRAGVLAALERATAAIIQQLAQSIPSSVTVSAFRHHPSGINRWFESQSDAPLAASPSTGVPQTSGPAVGELPVLGATQRPTMAIEWTEPDLIDDGLGATSETSRFDSGRADWTAVPIEEPLEQGPFDSAGGEFRITWPDGTSDESIMPAVVELPPEPLTQTASPDPAVPPTAIPAPLEIPAPLAPPNTMASTEPSVLDAPPVDAPLRDAAPATPIASVGSPLPPIPTFDTPPVAAVPPSPVGDTAFTQAPPVAPTPVASAPVTPAPAAAPAPAPVETPLPSATVEPLRIDRIPQPDAAVPDDVAAAVRRALRAIEDASNRSTLPTPSRPLDRLPELTVPAFMEPTAPTQQLDAPAALAEPAPLTSPDEATPSVTASAFPTAPLPAEPVFDGAGSLDDPVVAPPALEPEPASAPAPAGVEVRTQSPAPTLGFAPPTTDMRAEAVYERAAAEAEAELEDVDTAQLPPAFTGGATAEPQQERGQASVVFVDDEETDTGERRSALRRLIGSLRNKDN